MKAMKHSNKGVYPAFETQGRHHQKSKTGVSLTPTKKDQSPPNLSLKKTLLITIIRYYPNISMFGSVSLKFSTDTEWT